MKTLKDKVVLITGASSGIGWATAKAFAKRGTRIALSARREEKLKDLARETEPLGAEALVVPCDVSQRQQVLETVEAVMRRWGTIDVLINNAGINDYLRFMDHDLDGIEEIMRINYLGAVYMTHAVLPHMKAEGGGHIVNVASLAGIRGLPYMAAYCASKFAMVGLTEALRVELYDTNITLTAFCPGSVDTPMAAKALSHDPRLARTVSTRTAEEVAEKIVDATIRRRPEVTLGEVPGPVLKIMKLFPRSADWLTYQIYLRYKGLFPEKK